MTVSKILIEADQWCDFVPLVSAVSNLVDLFQKIVVIPLLERSGIRSGEYRDYLKQKSIYQCVAAAVPFWSLIQAIFSQLFNEPNKEAPPPALGPQVPFLERRPDPDDEKESEDPALLYRVIQSLKEERIPTKTRSNSEEFVVVEREEIRDIASFQTFFDSLAPNSPLQSCKEGFLEEICKKLDVAQVRNEWYQQKRIFWGGRPVSFESFVASDRFRSCGWNKRLLSGLQKIASNHLVPELNAQLKNSAGFFVEGVLQPTPYTWIDVADDLKSIAIFQSLAIVHKREIRCEYQKILGKIEIDLESDRALFSCQWRSGQLGFSAPCPGEQPLSSCKTLKEIESSLQGMSGIPYFLGEERGVHYPAMLRRQFRGDLEGQVQRDVGPGLVYCSVGNKKIEYSGLKPYLDKCDKTSREQILVCLQQGVVTDLMEKVKKFFLNHAIDVLQGELVSIGGKQHPITFLQMSQDFSRLEVTQSFRIIETDQMSRIASALGFLSIDMVSGAASFSAVVEPA